MLAGLFYAEVEKFKKQGPEESICIHNYAAHENEEKQNKISA